MAQNNVNDSKKNKKSYKTFLFFLGFTTFLWMALKFSNNYSKEIEFDIMYTQLPNRKAIQLNSDKKIKMILNGSGMQLLKYTLFKHTIGLDARKANTLTEKHAYFTGKRMQNLLRSGLGYSGDISEVFKDSLHIYYDIFIEKNVPVEIVFKINYSPGYTSVEGISGTPKDITVTGPKSILDTLKSVKTDLLELTDIKENYEGTIDINEDILPENIKVEEPEIKVNLQVDKLTEGEFQIPITLLNVPKGQRVQLFPKQVGVVFGVTLNNFPKLNVTDFSITANMMKAKEGSNKLLLKLENTPGIVYNARLREKEVQYIVIK